VTIGVLLLRKGFVKVVGAVVDAALQRGHRVILLWDPAETKPGERLSRQDLDAWPPARIVEYRRGAPLVALAAAEGLDALLAPSLHYLLRATGNEAEMPALRAAGVRLFSLDYVFETVSNDPAGHAALDVTFYMSEFERSLHRQIMADGFAAVGRSVDLAARSAVCGSTMTDQLALVDRSKTRSRYGLPPQGPVIVLMSLKMAVPDAWRRLVWGDRPSMWRAAEALLRGRWGWLPDIVGGHGYRELVGALREFAHRVGGVLVVKTREKNEDPRFLQAMADVFVDDRMVYPYTSIELMAVADLCVHFQSGAVLEAAFAGVPSVSVAVSQAHLEAYTDLESIYGVKPGSLQNFPGIVWSVPGDAAAGLFRSTSLADFRVDAEARRRYVEKFLGFDDLQASVLVLERIESAVAVRAGRGAAPPRG
jgi:hypothetical protein